MSQWNLADIWDTIADAQPDAEAVVQGDRRLSYAAFRTRASGVARWLVAGGATHQDKVAIYLHNCPELLETVYGSFLAGLVPANTNYRYVERELVYLWDNADAVAVVFHGSFSDRVAAVRDLVPKVRTWLWVDDGSDPCPQWADPYEEAAGSAGGAVRTPWGRSPDDVFMLYTGGTTGMPKGVMWRQDDLFARMQSSGFRRFDMEAGLAGIHEQIRKEGPGLTLAPASPLIHGTGMYTSIECLSEGGRVVLFGQHHLDPVEILDAVDKELVNLLVIVGDPFARPLVDALDADPGRWSLSSLIAVISSGAMWSEEVKQRMLRHQPELVLIDAFSSSEAIGIGASVSSAEGAARTAEFSLRPDVRVLGEDGNDVEPGSGVVGVLALGGRNPLGYYKDPERSDATFRVIGGTRYSIPGDYATVNEDGTVHLLGRGSVSINTAGEKVFPEEVEEALKVHPSVRDAIVVGVPNDRYGEEVVAVVELEPGETDGTSRTVDEDALIDLVKGQLAGYKAPKRVRTVPSIGRSPSGKVDYRRHRDEVISWLRAAPETSRAPERT